MDKVGQHPGVSLPRLADEPLDILVADVANLVFVVDGQQRHVGVTAYQHVERQYTCSATSSLALRTDSHTDFTHTAAEVVTTEGVFPQFLYKSLVSPFSDLYFLANRWDCRSNSSMVEI